MVEDFFFAVLIAGIMFGFGCHVGSGCENAGITQLMQKQAVENGVGEWRIKDSSGQVEFRWKPATRPAIEK